MDSDDYVKITGVFVCDYGWSESGDMDKFLFDDEKKDIEENATRHKDMTEKALDLMCGLWTTENNDQVINISVDDIGILYDEKYLDDNGEFSELIHTYVEVINCTFEQEENRYSIMLSTGESTAGIYFYITEDKEKLITGYDESMIFTKK